MNNYELAIDALDLTPYRREWCCVCGKPKTDGHHVVFRSHGGKDKHIISLCRECHRLAHVGRLKFKAEEGVLWKLSSPVPISIDKAMSRERYVQVDGNLHLLLKWDDLLEEASKHETEWSK